MKLSKERRAELWKVAESAYVARVYQECPWTTVVLTVEAGNKETDWFEVAGWSKVCWPDAFDQDRGYELALHDATVRLYNEMKKWYSEECGDGYGAVSVVENWVNDSEYVTAV